MSAMSAKQKQTRNLKPFDPKLLTDYIPSQTQKISSYIPNSSGRMADYYWNYRLIDTRNEVVIGEVYYHYGVPVAVIFPEKKEPSLVAEAFCNDVLPQYYF